MYLCAGPKAVKGQPVAQQGIYSEITAEAEIHLESKAMPASIVLVDTPGTNDPFELRSQRTEEYLRRADAYIVVLGDQAVFTAVDKRMVDTLIGLNKSKLVFVIAGLDRKNDPAKEGPRILADVVQKLGAQIKSATPQVAFVTSIWAMRGLTAEGRRKVLREFDKFADLVQAHKIATAATVASWEADQVLHAAAIEKAILKVSGIQCLRDMLASTLLREKGASLLESGRDNLVATARAAKTDVREKAAQLDAEAQVADTQAQVVPAEVRMLQAEAARLRIEIPTLTAGMKRADDELKVSPDGALEAMGQRLVEILVQQAEITAGQLSRITTNMPNWFEADLQGVRTALKSAAEATFQGVAKQVQEAKSRHLRSALQHGCEFLSASSELAFDRLKTGVFASDIVFAELGRPVGVELGGWWDWWVKAWANEADVIEKQKELRIAVVKAFGPIVDAMMENAAEAVSESINRHIEAVDRIVQSAITRHHQDLEDKTRRLQELAAADSPKARRAKAAKWRAEAEGLRDLERKVEALEHELTAYKAPIAAVAASPQG